MSTNGWGQKGPTLRPRARKQEHNTCPASSCNSSLQVRGSRGWGWVRGTSGSAAKRALAWALNKWKWLLKADTSPEHSRATHNQMPLAFCEEQGMGAPTSERGASGWAVGRHGAAFRKTKKKAAATYLFPDGLHHLPNEHRVYHLDRTRTRKKQQNSRWWATGGANGAEAEPTHVCHRRLTSCVPNRQAQRPLAPRSTTGKPPTTGHYATNHPSSSQGISAATA